MINCVNVGGIVLCGGQSQRMGAGQGLAAVW